MQNKYPLWKNLLLIVIALLGLIYALPNLFGSDPAIQITSTKNEITNGKVIQDQIKDVLTKEGLKYKSSQLGNRDILIRFSTTDEELKAKDAIKKILGEDYVVAAKIAPSTPGWLAKLGAAPAKLGLDLRGGVHFLLEVDVDSVVARRETGLAKSISQDLRERAIRYAGISRTKDQGISVRFRTAAVRDEAFALIKKNYPDLTLTSSDNERETIYSLDAKMSEEALNNSRQNTVEQTMSILRNRVDELGVGEAVVQQQGANRIGVDLPGIQDAARAKQVIGGTATLEFHLVDHEHDPYSAMQSGITPVGTKLHTYENRVYLLNNHVILSGESITGAMSTLDDRSGTPAVSIQLGGGGESQFAQTTRANVGKLMAILFVESKPVDKIVDGKTVRSIQKIERLISVATIREALTGNSFVITGLDDPNEAQNLALFLRAGALPASIIFLQERLIGPTLGSENVKHGLISLAVGTALILVIMLFYYHLFGLIADIALLLNLVLLIAVLSLMGATLTLPGIAGLVLTMGMAVDTNVLIYERIREELRHGMTPQSAIFAGYERAFSTIIDANVTTLIVAIVLFAIGTGPIQNFAVVLTIGLLTSMVTGIMFTRAIVNKIYGHRSVKKLSIGI